MNCSVLNQRSHDLQQRHIYIIFSGARHVEGGMDLHVTWPDGYHAWIFNHHLKTRPHCHLKLIEFYESRTKRKRREKHVGIPA